jgi:hypothetical protein
MARLSKTTVAELLPQIIGQPATPLTTNWMRVAAGHEPLDVYVSQCKPSSASDGKWDYHFFHTLGFETVQDIGIRSGILVLLNYVDKSYAVLDTADLMWVIKNSSRSKSNEGIVCDFVIDLDPSGTYYLRTYDRNRTARRNVKVLLWI